MKHILLTIFVLFFWGCRDHMDDMDDALTTTVVSSVVYYGDINSNSNSNSVVAIDLENMQLQRVIASSGVYPYEVAQGLGSDLYVMNRKDYNIGVLNTKTNTIDAQIDLNFYPRSVALNVDDVLVSSANKPSSAVASLGLISDTYQDSTYVTPSSYGGSNATGHPVWIDNNYFLLLDRTENMVELYIKGMYTPVDKLHTKSSVHHVMLRDGFYYGIAEGKQGEQDASAPGVVKFTVSEGNITLVKERVLNDFINDINYPSDFNSTSWGAHHGALHPTEDYIYMGSTEGNVFVMDLETLTLVDTFKSGKGIGHFLFYKDMLVTTNHYDHFKSFYDASDPENNTWIKDLSFSEQTYTGVTMQSHTSHIVDGNLYFTFNTDKSSTLYEVNLDTVSIVRSLRLDDRYCLMGSLVTTSTTTSTGM